MVPELLSEPTLRERLSEEVWRACGGRAPILRSPSQEPKVLQQRKKLLHHDFCVCLPVFWDLLFHSRKLFDDATEIISRLQWRA